MKSPIPGKLAKVRQDITSYLFHYVNRQGNPAETLSAILADGCIRGGIYPPSKIRTVCFTEAPLVEVVREDGVLDSHSYERLSLWGIGFTKQFIFEVDGLPVVYQPRSKLADLRFNAQWRHVDFDLRTGTDFTWQREWRVPSDELHFEAKNAILVVPNVAQFAKELWHVSVDVEFEDGELNYYSGVFKNWDFIPLEHADIADDSSIEICRGDDFLGIIQEEYYPKMDIKGP